jgi:trk system potassium uptake protein TrkA
VDVALNQADVLGHLILEGTSHGDMLTLLKLGGGRYSLVEAEVTEAAPAVGRSLASLSLPLDCVVVGILRQQELILPRGPTVVEAGDRVMALASEAQEEELRQLLEG